MMTRWAPYVVPAVCSGAIFAWEERARQKDQAEGKSRAMQGTIMHLFTRCIGAFQAGYLATSAPMGAVLVVVPYLGSKAAVKVSSFVATQLSNYDSEFVKSKKFTIITLCGMSLATFASYALYAPSLHWAKQAAVIAISVIASTVFYYLYRASLGKEKNQVLIKVHSWLMVPTTGVGVGVTVAAKNYMLRYLVVTHLGIVIEQVALRCFASSQQAASPRKA